MFRHGSRLGTWMLAAYLLFAGAGVVPASPQSKASPVAPDRARVEAVVREAYESFVATPEARMRITYRTLPMWIQSYLE